MDLSYLTLPQSSHKGSDTVRSSPASETSSHRPECVYVHDGFLLCHWFIGSDVALSTWRHRDGKDPEMWVYVQYSSLTLSRIYWIWCCSTGLKSPFKRRRRSASSATEICVKHAFGRTAAAAAAREYVSTCSIIVFYSVMDLLDLMLLYRLEEPHQMQEGVRQFRHRNLGQTRFGAYRRRRRCCQGISEYMFNNCFLLSQGFIGSDVALSRPFVHPPPPPPLPNRWVYIIIFYSVVDLSDLMLLSRLEEPSYRMQEEIRLEAKQLQRQGNIRQANPEAVQIQASQAYHPRRHCQGICEYMFNNCFFTQSWIYRTWCCSTGLKSQQR